MIEPGRGGAAVDPRIILATRRHLNAGPWITTEDYEASRSGFGCPRRLMPLLNEPIDEATTYTDLLVDAAEVIGRPLNYLEIGVAVGKNFATLAHLLEGASLFGFDWERINPSLDRRFEPIGDDDPSGPVRRFVAGGNRVEYVRGDLRRPDDWRPLSGRQYNLIFSDAVHQTDAVLHEYRMIRRLDLIDAGRFLMLWDDLDADPDGPMTSAFRTIAEDLEDHLGLDPEQVFTIGVNGWLGQHEHRHLVGVVNNVGITRKRYEGRPDG